MEYDGKQQNLYPQRRLIWISQGYNLYHAEGAISAAFHRSKESASKSVTLSRLLMRGDSCEILIEILYTAFLNALICIYHYGEIRISGYKQQHDEANCP